MPTRLETLYISADGVGQLAEETTDDFVVKLWTSSVRSEQLLRELSDLQFPSRFEAAPRKPADLITEYTPPTLFVETVDYQGAIRSWEGDPKRVPPRLASMIEKARSLVKSGDKYGLATGSRYIRAANLSTRAANNLRDAGLLREVTLSDLNDTPLVRYAIAHPRMLVGVDDVKDPYGKLGISSRGESVALAFGGCAFQVRNLQRRAE
ncbi:MAG: hypothetical protein N3B12_00475 [Armatimonadetes bacterium]|nr:hypothetical protein [Armatimonadota bacterium]